jgi:glutathionylspermidine amidase/synthetase
VFEPLWTLIPSSKAILAVLWSLHPNHPYLLKSSFELTPELQASGYVTKPVGGRAGNNVKLIDPKGQLLVKTEGQFTESQDIYQVSE